MSWNYRLMATPDGNEGMWFEIHEVYYDEEGKPKNYTTIPAEISGNNIDDIMFSLNAMKEAVNRPILWMEENFPEEFDYDEWIKNKK